MAQAKADILIVDDTQANLSILTLMLSERGYRTRPAINGQVALKIVQNTRPDLILLDIMMPGLDGYEVCRQLKANEKTRDIPVIFISALSDVLDKVKAFGVGGVDYITKPFEAQEVLARVETHLALQVVHRRMQDELTLAREIQYGLLPLACPNWPHLDVKCFTRPAREIGGDFYAYHDFELGIFKTTNPKYAIAVGDVSGKGVSAALLMAASLSQFDASFSQNLTPTERLAYLDKAIATYTKPRKQNCAMCYVEIEVRSKDINEDTLTPYSLLPTSISIVNAGCIPPYIKRVTGAVENPEIGGFALGQELSGATGYQHLDLTLHKGDMVILVSDGVVEAHNTQGGMVGFESMITLIQNAPTSSAEDMLAYLKQAILAFTGNAEQHDDMTIVVARV